MIKWQLMRLNYEVIIYRNPLPNPQPAARWAPIEDNTSWNYLQHDCNNNIIENW